MNGWSPGRSALELAGVCALTIAQPVLGVLVLEPTFFVARRLSPPEIAAFVAALVLAPPVAMWIVEWIVSRVTRAGAGLLHVAFLGAMVTTALLPVLERGGLTGASLLLAPAAGILAALAHAKAKLVRDAFAASALSFLIVPAAFLLDPAMAALTAASPEEATAEARATTPVPVVMVVFDELPLSALLDERHDIDEGRFPSFAALQRSSTFYAGAVATASQTRVAVPELLTGAPGRWDAVPSYRYYPRNLFSLLAPTHVLRVLEGPTALCPRRRCDGSLVAGSTPRRVAAVVADATAVYLHVAAPAAWERRLPPLDGKWGGFWDGSAPAAGSFEPWREPDRIFRTAISTLAPSSKPVFTYVHVLLPHLPHLFLPTGDRYASGWDGMPSVWPADGREALIAEQRHLLQVGFADRLLGDLVARLVQRGIWDETLLVVTSDHGVSFQPGRGARTPDEVTIGDIAPIPLFVKFPGQRQGQRDDSTITSRDMLGLIAPVLGLPLDVTGRGVPASTGDLELTSEAGTHRYRDARAVLRRSVERKRALFGGATWDGVFVVGPRADLVGSQVGAAPIMPRGEAIVDRREALASSGGSPGLVPALIEGEVSKGTPKLVGVAIDGVIASVVAVDREGGGRFRALVPWWLLGGGSHDVRLLEVDPSPGGPVLGELLQRGDSASLLSSKAIRDMGRSYVIGDCGLRGEVEAVEHTRDRLFVRGWAAHRTSGGVGVAVFVGDGLAARTSSGLRRADVAADLGLVSNDVGFAVDVPWKMVNAPAPVRVFALHQSGCAQELATARSP